MLNVASPVNSQPRHRTRVWSPQKGPQDDLVCCPCQEVFFGGARGGGKTDGVLGKWAIKEQRYGRHFNAVMFRRTTVSAEDAIERSKEIYAPMGGVFNEAKLRWRMPHGGRVSFSYLENVKDANEYQGRNITDAWVEEAGQYPDHGPIDRLFGVLRSAHGVPVQLILTANPGGAGQHWIRDRYRLSPFPAGPKRLKRHLPNGGVHTIGVIPSRISDNRYLGADYVQRLHLVGSAQLIKAWLLGDWTAIEGAFFDCWNEAKHVIPPFVVPDDWLRFRSADWGSASPASIGWWAVVQDDYPIRSAFAGRDEDGAARLALGELKLDAGRVSGIGSRGYDEATTDRLQSDARLGSNRAGRIDRFASVSSGIQQVDVERNRILPRGAIVRYREDYIASGPGKGLKLTAEQVAERIIEREKDDPKLAYGVMDPSAFREDGGPSIAERINTLLIKARKAPFREADNARVARAGNHDRGGPMGGWDQVRARMVGADGVPTIYCFATCTDSIRTIPVLQHDPARAEDLDTTAEDHAADDWRYACMSRPWLRTPPEPEPLRDAYVVEREDRPNDSFKLL
jgi:hypothetical protein